MKTNQDRLIRVIAHQLNVEPSRLIPEARFRQELGADSLDLVELMIALEDEFEVEISDKDAAEITTVGEAIVYLHQRDAH
ncbi:MAG: acyl carrier protein [Anaerolineae bacterium]|nr:acyl carrier protein [Anaerolineae bacterium]